MQLVRIKRRQPRQVWNIGHLFQIAHDRAVEERSVPHPLENHGVEAAIPQLDQQDLLERQLRVCGHVPHGGLRFNRIGQRLAHLGRKGGWQRRRHICFRLLAIGPPRPVAKEPVMQLSQALTAHNFPRLARHRQDQ